MQIRFYILSTLLLASAILPASATQICRSEVEIPSSTLTNNFTDNGDGTVTDKRTGLMWVKCTEGLSGSSCNTGTVTSYTWDEAFNFAKKRSFKGYKDWRIPNNKELRSIVERQCHNPSINTLVFPNTPASNFWSASPDSEFSSYAWYVNFYFGGTYHKRRTSSLPVRLVRSVR